MKVRLELADNARSEKMFPRFLANCRNRYVSHGRLHFLCVRSKLIRYFFLAILPTTYKIVVLTINFIGCASKTLIILS